jgi:helix-turn-helix protein
MSIASTSVPHDPSGAGKLAYSIPEACAASGLSRSMLYLALKDGRLCARKAGARTIIESTELRRFIASLPTTGGRNAA